MSVGLSHRLRLQYPGTYLMWCPGCKEVHALVIDSPQEFAKRLGFDGIVKCPSFDPAVIVSTSRGLCIFELRAGALHFRPNCHHELRGTVVELPTFPMSTS